MPPLAGTDTIAGSRGCVPRLSAGVRSGSKALSYQGLALVAAPPPLPKPQPFAVGVFFLPDRADSRVFARIRVANVMRPGMESLS